MNRNGLAPLFVSAAAGMMVWYLSPMFTGQVEPWDSNTLYYPAALVIAGFVSAFSGPSRFWLCPIGIFAGQLLYGMLFLELGPLFVIGIVFLAIYSLLSLVGATLTWAIARLCRSRPFFRHPE